MKPHLSARTSWELTETSYARALRQARAENRSLIDLTSSNPTRCSFNYNAHAVQQPLTDPLALTYQPDPRGLPAARNAISAYYCDHNAAVAPEQLILTASTSESYSFLFRLLCDAGDEVLIAQPSYPLFDLLAALDDVALQPFPVFHDHGWWIDFAELERRIGPRTRAIIVVHPNNPTGHWTSPDERRQLEAICADRGLALIVDEVFLDYPLAEGDLAAASFARAPHAALTFVLSGLSKVAALPQMKAAWIAAFGPRADEALGRLEVMADTFLSVSAPVQLALPHWLAGRGEIQKQIRDRIRTNLQLLESFAATHPDRLHVRAPAAGWTAVVSVARCGGASDCAERLISERGIVVHPGAFYGLSGANAAVLSLLTETATLRAGLERL